MQADEGQLPSKKDVREAESVRLSDQVLRAIRENPGRTAKELGRILGAVAPREVRERIKRARDRGARIVIGVNGVGYIDLGQVEDETYRKDLVQNHRERTRAYLIDSAELMKQIGGWTAGAIAQQVLFDLLVPDGPAGGKESRPATMQDLARLPMPRRKGVVDLLVRMLQGIADDPEAYAYERTFLADKFGRIFITRGEAAKIAEARKLLEGVGV
jgi:hypothetical protein